MSKRVPENFTPEQIDFLRYCGVRVVPSGETQVVHNEAAAKANRALQRLREQIAAALEGKEGGES